MTKLNPESQVQSFRLIIELENRSEQIENLSAQLRQMFLDNPTNLSLPDAVGCIHDLDYQLSTSAKILRVLEGAVGIQRKPLKQEAGDGESLDLSDPAPATFDALVPGDETSETVESEAASTEPAPEPTDESVETNAEADTEDKKPAGSKRPRRDMRHALRGTTRSIRIPDLISLLSQQHKTGTLWIRSKDETFLFEILNGAVVHAASDASAPESRLGMILVAQQKISTERLEEFLDRHDSESCPIGQAMADAELVTESDLRDALAFQVRALFQRVFALDLAQFCFLDGPVRDLELRVTMNVTQLLLESALAQDHTVRDEEPWDEDQDGEEPMDSFGEDVTEDAMAADDDEAPESSDEEEVVTADVGAQDTVADANATDSDDDETAKDS